jgi:alpha-galactosidase
VVRREHPEWLHHVGGQISPVDKRSILHLGVPEARTFARERILKILKATGATWMKWDFNTSIYQGGWSPQLPETLTRRDPILAHYEGVYQLQDELRNALPNLTLEMCAGGGGRFDAALLSHAHTNWMSDQTNPLQNLAIHFGSHLEHTAIACNDWLIEWPPHSHFDPVDDLRGDLAFRTRIAMLGTFGVSAPVDDWTESDIQVVKTHVDWYKRLVRPVIHHGDQYLLTEAPPLDGQGDWAAVWFASKDRRQGILFAFRLEGPQAEHLFEIPGLHPDWQYRLNTPEGLEWTQSGSALAGGLHVTLDTPFQSMLVAVSCMD